MPRRIDIDGGDPQHDIEEALRQLDPTQRAPERDVELERAVQEVGEQQKTTAARRARKASPWLARLGWAGLGVAVVALVVVAIVLMRPEPPPPPAATAETAVRNFWTFLIEGKYESAALCYPTLAQNYGTPAQAADRLREVFSSNPPAVLRSVGKAEPIPDGNNYRVTYNVVMKSGQARDGEFVVTNHGAEGSLNFVIIDGGV
jgi:hypothetical protein